MNYTHNEVLINSEAALVTKPDNMNYNTGNVRNQAEKEKMIENSVSNQDTLMNLARKVMNLMYHKLY